jgi:RNA polymerase sigma factor (sigma-70 family)
LARAPRREIYKPASVPLERLQQVILLPEELEALRLADLDGLSQQEAAAQMGVSRSTFQRILQRARRQVALALVEGQALRLGELAPEQG